MRAPSAGARAQAAQLGIQRRFNAALHRPDDRSRSPTSAESRRPSSRLGPCKPGLSLPHLRRDLTHTCTGTPRPPLAQDSPWALLRRCSRRLWCAQPCVAPWPHACACASVSLSVSECACMRVVVCACACACMRTRVCVVVCARVHLYARKGECVFVCVCLCPHIRACVLVCVSACACALVSACALVRVDARPCAGRRGRVVAAHRPLPCRPERSWITWITTDKPAVACRSASSHVAMLAACHVCVACSQVCVACVARHVSVA